MDETKLKDLLASLTLVKNPELIKVSTINPRIVEQMQFLDSASVHDTLKAPDYDKVEIVGVCQKSYCIVVRDKQGKLGKLHVLNFLMYLRETRCETPEESNEVLHALPQLFEV